MSDSDCKTPFPVEPLAIVGMACRLPGADDLESYWDLMAASGSGVSEMPSDRLNRRLYFSNEQGKLSKTYSSISGLIPKRSGDPSSDFRSIDHDQLQWDPCHEILCGVVEQARLNAGWTTEQLSGGRTGVYIGHCSGSALGGELVFASLMPEVAYHVGKTADFQNLPESERLEILSEVVTRIQHQRPLRRVNKPTLEANLAAQLIASRFHLDGPQMAIDAACASSLLALALASMALTEGEIDQAIVSSASYSKSDSLVLFSHAQSCSATSSRPFDAKANGLVNAEGYVTVLIKTLAKAETDGDKIQSIIRGIGVSSDGRGRSLWAPRKEGQLEAVRRAYSGTVTKDSVQYVEAHATSTQVGDATELEALAAYFYDPANKRKIPLGSVKSNIGHTLESAGLASLVKCVLGMQKGLIPSTINLSELNPSIDWDKHPFCPVTTLMPWPDVEHQPRRAAVNSFGIGGLNAHVVLDGPPSSQNRAEVEVTDSATIKVRRHSSNPAHRSASDDRAIAIIGRGLVIPGASGLNGFTELLQSKASQLVSPPAERWQDTPFSGTRPTIQQAFANAKGGYILDYKYDWRMHQIPPLQIAHANPLQFMLLDATQQALDESGYSSRPFDKSRAAVVVGTLFGGDFSHQLQVGLRLPEILDELANTLKCRHWDDSRIQSLCQSAEAQILKVYPAIKDQTGSFTCSTQASRIAKTLNIMGGAVAIDCGDCSSLAALQSAQHMLGSRVADFVFCAAAQRNLDSAAFDAWNHRTFNSLDWNDRTPSDANLYPGEGVVVLMLRRLADAVADNDKIYGVIRDVRASRFTGQLAESIKKISRPPQKKITADFDLRSPTSSELTQQFGHLQGASGLLEIVTLTASNRPKYSQSVVLNNTKMSEYHAVYETASRMQHTTPDLNGSSTVPFGTTSVTKSESRVKTEAVRTTIHRQEAKIIRIWGVCEQELRQRLASLPPPSESKSHESLAADFPSQAPYRLAIVTTDDDFQVKRQISLDLLNQGKPGVRVQEHGIYYCRSVSVETPQLAVMFPGQGSQSSGMMSDVIKSSMSATRMLERADKSLSGFGLLPCSNWIAGDEARPENELQSTQIAMLTADVCAYQAIREWGLRPDFLIGHSFGEYAALVATGSLEFESAIAITLARANAVAECTHSQGSMLSIAATPKEVQPLLAGQSDVFLSHFNAPRQTVVAGTMQGVIKLAKLIKDRGIPAVQVPVGSPFHTPLLASAQSSLKVALAQHRWRPPRVPTLSSVSGRFVAERDEIIDNLTRQLTQPLNWVANIERIFAENVRIFLEIGPGRVLGKLTQQIIGDRDAFVISLENPSISVLERQLRIQAAMETVGIQMPNQPTVRTENRVSPDNATRNFNFADVAINSEASSEKSESTPQQFNFDITPAATGLLDEIESDSQSDDALLNFLIDMIVEQTGYPRDVIQIDLDLEADLGIDSIRKAMILGELREFFEMPADLDRNVLNEMRTLREILALIKKCKGKGEWLQSPKVGCETEVPIRHSSTLEFTADNSNESPSVLVEVSLPTISDDATFLIDFVVERTGYPRDVVDLDADLESDLGIDSIAKAQLIGEARDHFHWTIDENSIRSTLADLRTLRQIQDMIKLASPATSPEVKTELLDSTTNWPDAHGHIDESDNHRMIVDSNAFKTLLTVPPDWSSFLNRDDNLQDSELDSAFDRGKNWGRQNRHVVQNQLFDFADRAALSDIVVLDAPQGIRSDLLNLVEEAELLGVAVGADVHPQNVFSIRDQLQLPSIGSILHHHSGGTDDDTENLEHPNGTMTDARDDHDLVSQPFLTQRFRLEMSPAEIRNWSGVKPEFAGGAIVIGNHAECEELVRRLESFDVTVTWLRELGTRDEAVSTMDKIWKTTPSPHLFILSPRDSAAATTLEESQWKARRETGITSLFWFCQRWIALIKQAKLFDDASLIGVTALGGDFGISNICFSAESGGLAGLLKAIVIECWVNGHRTTPVKLLDLPMNSYATAVVDAIFVELTEPSYDVEIGWNGTSRSVSRVTPAPLAPKSTALLIPSGNWIVTGGARGITAFIVGQMAGRYPDVHFHLIGTAPHPTLSEDQRRLAKSDLARMRAEMMHQAKANQQLPIKAWQLFEKEIEIDRSLSEFRAAGINVTYHSCDVANRQELSAIFAGIRQQTGPITGVIHGAGIGKDASYHKKDPSMVERCLSAKLDGAVNLMELTRNDPLQAFIAFGSISGRFGANGHTDYSLANDMLAKLVGWHRQVRPSVPSTVFHWHAWDDIGMATKPETKMALRMIGMTLMPAREGAKHFLREIEANLPLAEVIITDTRYYRMFYPADRMLEQPLLAEDDGSASVMWPLVRSKQTQGGEVISEATLDPVADPFLREHLLRNRPLLPMVIMTELLAESACVARKGNRPTCIRDLEIINGLKFLTNSCCEVQLSSRKLDAHSSATELRSDFYSRSGKLIDANRLYAKAIIEFDMSDSLCNEKPQHERLSQLNWQQVEYPPVGSVFYSGGPLQCLRKFAVDAENGCIWGRISAPSLSELAGPNRDVTNWLTPSAVLDAALFTSGILAWSIRPGVTLPQGAKRIRLQRCPRPAEVCWVRSKLVNSDESKAIFDITIWDDDDRPLLAIQHYLATWLAHRP